MITVDGVVAVRDFQPYLRLLVDGVPICQLTMAQARQVASDIVQMSARTEADAMIHRFFAEQHFPPEAGAALMLLFRDFRLELDSEPLETGHSDPDERKPS